MAEFSNLPWDAIVVYSLTIMIVAFFTVESVKQRMAAMREEEEERQLEMDRLQTLG